MTAAETTLEWGYKLVGTDLCTDDHRGGRFRYRLGEWHDSPGPYTATDCPTRPGDGLCVARTLSGAQSGGARLGSSVMLLVGFLPEDVLCDSGPKIKVKRLFVHPDPLDPIRVLTGPRADLTGASLSCANFSGAYLSGAYLSGADLTRAYLAGADLSGANLSGANLSGANLTRVNLYRANLTGADLTRADLTRADLTRADLTRVNLYRANLTGADLIKADLTGADLTGANLYGANLYGANLAHRPSWLPERWTVTANGFITEAQS